MRKLGPVAEKILLLLEAGIVLSLTARPDAYFRVVKKAIREWQKINARSLHRTIKRLYQSHLVEYKEHKDGTISLLLTNNGRKRLLRYRLDTLAIPEPARWDGLWRMVVFDIPEKVQHGRKALLTKLKELGFYPLQKSVLIFPYECKDEIDFLIEVFQLRPYVRYAVIKDIDNALDLKHKFNLL